MVGAGAGAVVQAATMTVRAVAAVRAAMTMVLVVEVRKVVPLIC